MSLNSTLKKKPMSAVATLDLNLSAQHSLQNAKADEKIHAGSGNGANAVSGAELWAARIGFFAGGFTVASEVGRRPPPEGRQEVHRLQRRRGRPRRLHGPLHYGGQPPLRAGGHDDRGPGRRQR